VPAKLVEELGLNEKPKKGEEKETPHSSDGEIETDLTVE
jgi:hypothetical protein